MKSLVINTALVLAVAVGTVSTAQAGGNGRSSGGSRSSMSSSYHCSSSHCNPCYKSYCNSWCGYNNCWYPYTSCYSYCYQPVQYYPLTYVSVVPTTTCAVPVCEPVATTSNYTVRVNVQVSSRVSQGPVVGNQYAGGQVPH